MDSQVFSQIIERPHLLFAVLIAGVIVFSSFMKCISSCVKHVSRERTRREIAAYIAEGTISPEQGERLIKADPRQSSCS